MTEDDEDYEGASIAQPPPPPVQPRVSPQDQSALLQAQAAAVPSALTEAPWVLKLLASVESVNETNKMLVEQSNKRSRDEDSGASSAKAKKGRITEPDPKDESLWLKGSFDVSDNGSNVLGGLSLRAALGGVSSDPKVWYTGFDDLVKTPRRGSSLVTTHLLGARILHPQVVF